MRYGRAMPPPDHSLTDETLLEQRRHARTLRALADVDANRLIDDDAMAEWADSLGTPHERPVPQPD